MKADTKTRSLSCSFLTCGIGLLALSTLPLQATIIYQDTFDNDGLATNTGIGGGLQEFEAPSGSGGAGGLTVVDDGNLTSPSTGHNNRGNFFSLNTFDLTGGFTLTAELDLLSGNVQTGNASRAMFGLISDATTPARFGNIVQPDSIAFSPVGDFDGLVYEGTEIDNTLSLDATTGFQTVTISVAANGLDYTYSVDGVSESGTLASAFDFTEEYYIVGAFQDAESFTVYESITLEVVPEPSSAALLGLGGLALILRRRKWILWANSWMRILSFS